MYHVFYSVFAGLPVPLVRAGLSRSIEMEMLVYSTQRMQMVIDVNEVKVDSFLIRTGSVRFTYEAHN